MAILKHLSSKSANYGKALEYLIFQHDEHNGRPLRDDDVLTLAVNNYR